MRHRCECGGPIKWETRTTWQGRRFLGICINRDCGLFTTQPADGEERESDLARFLLEDAPLRPDTPPQLRLFLRYAGLGWRHHHTSCDCGGRMIFSLDLLRLPSRLYDPVGIVLCLDCGRLTSHQVLMAELISVQALPGAWNDFSPVISGVKEALAVRSQMAFGPRDHDALEGP